jgi:hypothetical protein
LRFGWFTATLTVSVPFAEHAAQLVHYRIGESSQRLRGKVKCWLRTRFFLACGDVRFFIDRSLFLACWPGNFPITGLEAGLRRSREGLLHWLSPGIQWR